jgi:hypothetical protein
MSKENMQLGEGFSATVTKASEPPKTRHYWIGWALVAALAGGGGYAAHEVMAPEESAVLKESPSLKEGLTPQPLKNEPIPMKNILGMKFGGVLSYDIIRAAINLPKSWDMAAQVAGLATGHKSYEQTHFGPIPNTIVNEGENTLEDCFEANTGSACTQVALWKFHGLGTSSAAIAETDGGCTTELTTQYTGNVRATGTQTNNGANIYRSVATNTLDEGATVEEFCLMDTNTGAGLMWTRILTGTIVLSAADAVATTYDLTIE